MDKIKTTIKTLPKYVSILILTAGFIYCGIQLADNDRIVGLGVVLLALFLTREASK